MAEKEWSVEEIIESLRTWQDDFYSESETQWLMDKAADLIESLQKVNGILRNPNANVR